MRAALRHLCQHGVEALKPQKVITKNPKTNIRIGKPGGEGAEVWRRPVVSKRVGNVIRKQAIKDGTYGSFDATTGIGWDPTWDIVLKSNQYNVSRYGGMKPNKLHARVRGREDRAQTIEKNLETRLEKMEEYYVNKEKLRVKEEGFEANFKRMMEKGGKRR